MQLLQGPPGLSFGDFPQFSRLPKFPSSIHKRHLRAWYTPASRPCSKLSIHKIKHSRNGLLSPAPLPPRRTQSMSFPTTEIAFLPFPPNSKLEDATSYEGSTYQSVVAKAISLKGFTRGYAGRQVEHPDTVQMLVGSCFLT